MEYKTRNTNDELTHWGVIGMKWGVRRYQNSDGSLTAAGKKRYASEAQALKEKERTLKKRQAVKDKVDKLTAKRKELAQWEDELNGKRVPTKPVHKKTASEMTDQELWERTVRLQAEANYYNAQKNLATANPKKVSAGQRFISSLMNEVVAPAAKSAGKAWLENTLKDKLGLNEKDVKDTGADLKEALEVFKNTSKDQREEVANAAKFYENVDKIRKKGKNND